MVQERFQSPVGDAGRLEAQRQYVLAGERIRVDELNRVLILSTVNGDGRHLPGHERLEHSRLVRVVVRPELFAPDHRAHVVPELGRSVQHVAPPDTYAGQRHALRRREIREEPVEELFVAHQFRPRDRSLDAIRGRAIPDRCSAAEPWILDAASTAAATAGTEAAAAATAAAQHVRDPFHDTGADARRARWRTGRATGGTGTAGRRRFVGRTQRQPVDALGQFSAGAFHHALAGHGREAVGVSGVPTVVIEVPVMAVVMVVVMVVVMMVVVLMMLVVLLLVVLLLVVLVVVVV